MDFNQSKEISPANPSPQVQNAMPILPHLHQVNKAMVRSDTPVIISKACEMFIEELMLRAWLHTERCNRRTLQRSDIAKALKLDELFHFLHHKYGENENENGSEANELLPANQLPFPDIYFPDVYFNENPLEEVSQQLKIKPTYSALKFNNGSTSQSQVRKEP
ncbi:hypothetical protein QYF36_009894 [Acer negundo]|nr:hypothetical protein QYF36_009894 [Acer negundo]